MLVTALNPHIGYEKAAQISLKAYREDISLRDAALALGYVTAERVRRLGPPGGHDASLVNGREEGLRRAEGFPSRLEENSKSARKPVFKADGRKIQIFLFRRSSLFKDLGRKFSEHEALCRRRAHIVHAAMC